jgi:hypothetical protein
MEAALRDGCAQNQVLNLARGKVARTDVLTCWRGSMICAGLRVGDARLFRRVAIPLTQSDDQALPRTHCKASCSVYTPATFRPKSLGAVPVGIHIAW